MKSIKVLNCLGGAMFANGLMLGIQAFINADGNRTRDTIRSQLSGPKSEEQCQVNRRDTGNQGEHIKTAL